MKNSFTNIIRVSNSLDPGQAQNFVRPDLGPNCLQKLSADDTRRQRINHDLPIKPIKSRITENLRDYGINFDGELLLPGRC